MGMSIGKFTVLAKLGEGAHSSILHIRRQADSKEYALKVVPVAEPEEKKYLEQAKHEFRVAQMLGHPNLVQIHALEIEKKMFIWPVKANMLIEYIPGKAMDEIPPVPIPKLLPMLVQVAGGLTHMHRRGVCHGDLKPNNLMLGRGNRVKVIDFGLAWIKGENKERIQGTPEYMAPETAAKKVVNEQTDIFNFGATMYRLATWRTPPSVIIEGARVKSKEYAAVLQAVEECNASAPKEFAEFIHKCMAFKPDKRPERMSEVKEELERLAEEFGEPGEE